MAKTLLWLLLVVACAYAVPNPFAAYQQTVNEIVAKSMTNTEGYARLCEMCDDFGPRLSGSEGLELALDWIAAKMRADGLDNVVEQDVLVPKWVRGEESLEMVLPRGKKMSMLGLGGSIGTPAEGLTGEVIVVESFDELEERSAEVKGKIVVYNVPFSTYGGTSIYRREGAARAAQFGAIASLTRSITPYSLDSPHTGSMSYSSEAVKIPSAAITVEDALLLARLTRRGETPVLHLYMSAKTEADSLSRNVMAEITGSEKPEEVVLIGGHIDSWDVGSGAQDDGGGCLISWEALRVLKELGLKPKRTIRAVLFTNEENGGRGATAYFNSLSKEQVNNTVFAMESDAGTFHPTGFAFQGQEISRKTFQVVVNLLKETLGDLIVESGGAGADISELADAGVPAAGLRNDQYYEEEDMYFWYHHTNADTPDHVAPEDFNASLAVWASMAFVMADIDITLPRV